MHILRTCDDKGIAIMHIIATIAICLTGRFIIVSKHFSAANIYLYLCVHKAKSAILKMINKV